LLAFHPDEGATSQTSWRAAYSLLPKIRNLAALLPNVNVGWAAAPADIEVLN
jgi:hypothetical protein